MSESTEIAAGGDWRHRSLERRVDRLEARLDRMDERRFADWQALIKAEAIVIWLLAVGLFVLAGTQA